MLGGARLSILFFPRVTCGSGVLWIPLALMPSPECVPFAQRFLASCFAGLFRPRAKAPVQLAEFERQLFGCPKCPPLSLTRAPRSGGSLLKSFCDEVLGGGTSLASLYGYLDLTQAGARKPEAPRQSGDAPRQALLMLRPTCQAAAAAAKARLGTCDDRLLIH